MTSREAFEAWYFGNPITPSHAADKNADGQYKYAAAHTAWNVWQAATDRARDVAVKACDGVQMRADAADVDHNDKYHEGRSDGAAQCAAAIKEALK